MTRRLYYTEPYRTRFEAQVVERLTWDGRPAVVLDQTAFYPASGGQPADRGTVDAAEVLDVVEREPDSAIVHVVSHDVPRTTLEGRVDWQRRFDHMQQHTGQHILSAAFERELGLQTVGFHLGAASSTIDLDTARLGDQDLRRAELLANQVIWDDRPVVVRVADADGLAELQVEPPAHVKAPIRLLIIPGSSKSPGSHFDVNPCGGTHVARTGEVGMVKTVALDHRGEETRLTFLCGRRALQDYRDKNDLITALANRLTVGYWELDTAVERLDEENQELRRTERQLRHQLLDLEAARLMNAADARGPYRVVGQIWEARSSDEIRTLARKLTDHPGMVALLFSSAERVDFCFARSEDLDLNVNDLLQEACGMLGGKGGGRPQVAQGSAPAVPLSVVEQVLHHLLAHLGPLRSAP